MICYVLLDVEGTTTDIHYVHDVLFPYSATRLRSFVLENCDNAEVKDCIQSVKNTLFAESQLSIDDEDAVSYLLKWIEEDRKLTALKTLQGLIWKEGYENHEFQTQIYEDVVTSLRSWTSLGIKIGIFSSGSTIAQQLLFRHTRYGDLTPFLSDYFDTRIGGKRDVQSYMKIAKKLGIDGSCILFVSDVEEELDAASQSGFVVMRVVRDGSGISSKYAVIHSLDEIMGLQLQR
jgi:enolase-phosphatase E1